MERTKVTVGIDVGGTNTVFGFVSEAGKIIFESSIPTRAEQKADQLFLKNINQLFWECRKFQWTMFPNMVF